MGLVVRSCRDRATGPLLAASADNIDKPAACRKNGDVASIRSRPPA